MTKPTPRTDAEFADVRFHNISKELTAKAAELEEAKETIRLLTTDVNYVGGIQYWQKQHHEVLVAGILASHELKQKEAQLRKARAAAFEEAADMGLTVDDKWVQSGIDTLSAEIHKKAASIRKGEL